MNNSKNISASWWWLVISILLVIIIYWRWFFTANIYTWGDWGYHNKEFIGELFQPPQAWHREFLGLVDIGIPQYPTTRLFYSMLAHLFRPEIYDRLIFMFPSVLIPSISVFLLVENVTKNRLAAFVGSMVY